MPRVLFRLVLSISVSPLELITFFYVLVCCYYFCFIVKDRYHMLVVSGWLMITRSNGPTVLLLNYIFCSHIDHRFDRKYHPLNNLCSFASLTIVWYFRIFVQIPPYTMTYKFPHHTVTKLLNITLHRMTHIPNPMAGFRSSNAEVQ